MKIHNFMPNLTLALLLVILLWPSADSAVPLRLVILTLVIEVAYLLRRRFASSPGVADGAGDVAAILYVVLLAWHLATARLGLLDKMLFPTPEAVLTLFASEFPVMLIRVRRELWWVPEAGEGMGTPAEWTIR